MRTWKLVSLGSITGSFLALALVTVWSCNSQIGEGPMDASVDNTVFTPPPPPDLHFDPDAFWADDPPLMSCVADGGMLPPPTQTVRAVRAQRSAKKEPVGQGFAPTGAWESVVTAKPPACGSANST